MALDKSALCDLLAALRAGGDLDVVRSGLRLVLQALIELEATEVIGAQPYERRPERTTHRNGHRARLLSTKAGDVELRIPKLRQGAFFPALLEPRRRIDRALWAVVMESYVHGVSTRKVKEVTEELCGTAFSKSLVSQLAGSLDSELEAWRDRRLEAKAYPYLFVDARLREGQGGWASGEPGRFGRLGCEGGRLQGDRDRGGCRYRERGYLPGAVPILEEEGTFGC